MFVISSVTSFVLAAKTGLCLPIQYDWPSTASNEVGPIILEGHHMTCLTHSVLAHSVMSLRAIAPVA